MPKRISYNAIQTDRRRTDGRIDLKDKVVLYIKDVQTYRQTDGRIGKNIEWLCLKGLGIMYYKRTDRQTDGHIDLNEKEVLCINDIQTDTDGRTDVLI